MRIVQLIDSLEAGGAERMAVNYANALVGNIWFSIANRLFIREKIYNQLESAIISELKDSGLMK